MSEPVTEQAAQPVEEAITEAAGPESTTETESGPTDWEKEAARLRTELTKSRKWEKQAKDASAKLKDADPVKIKAEIASAIAKAMGLEEEPPDPAALTQQLTAQTAAARDAQVELAVYRIAGTAEGDPAALLDSRSFMNSLSGVDPTDQAAVQAAITAAVAANPVLKAAAARRVPGPNPALGSSASGAPDVEAQIAAAQKAGDFKTVISLQNQKLTAPQR